MREEVRTLVELLDRGDLEAALRYLGPLERERPRSGPVLYHLGKVYRRLGDLERALDYHGRACRLDPANAVFVRGRGMVLQDMGRLEEAEEAYAESARLRENYVEAWNSLGLLWLTKGDALSAAGAFYKAIIEKVRWAQTQVGASVAGIRDAARAAEGGATGPTPITLAMTPEAAELLVREGRLAMLFFNRGMSCVSLDRWDDAQRAFEQAIAFGLSGVELANAKAWLADHEQGRLRRRVN